MAPQRATDLLLFVASTTASHGLVTAMKAGQCAAYSPELAVPPLPRNPVTSLPRPQLHCMNTVLRIARRVGRTVTVVDVERAAGRQELVDRWVHARDALPLLVRPDGRRLSGLDGFLPEVVRQFIVGA